MEELRYAATKEYEAEANSLQPVGADLEAPTAPIEPEQAVEEHAEPAKAKPRKLRRKRSSKTSLVIGGEEPDPPVKPTCDQQAKVPAPAGTLALPAPPKPCKTKSTLTDVYDPNLEDAQDPRAFEKGSPAHAPPNNLAISPPRPSCLLDQFSAAAADRPAVTRKLAPNPSNESDAMLSPGTLSKNLQAYLRESKDPWRPYSHAVES